MGDCRDGHMDQHWLEMGRPEQKTAAKVDTLAWQNLGVCVSVRAINRGAGARKQLLDNSHGIARPGELMALMGPSGSGKTTLLNTLAQRQSAAVVGQVLINGREVPLATHQAVSAYVEQEDTLIGSVTVQETLRFAAELTLSKNMSPRELDYLILDLITAFGLQKQAHTLIGTPFRKGLSGGQKRRVSVVSQLIAGPSVLYLDEPTSGLDSVASYEVMSFVKKFAKQHNIIVIASIHQPSTKTFELFDQVTLLSQGRTCFTGYRTELGAYFAELGLAITPNMNPAEHVLDLVNVDFTEDAGAQKRLKHIIAGWEASFYNKHLIASIARVANNPSGGDAKELRIADRKPGAGKKLVTLLRRSLIKSYRDLVVYWVRVVMYLGLAIMMGTVWLHLPTTQDHIQDFINAIFFGSAFMSFMAVAYVPAFLEDQSVFVKERQNGLYGATLFMLSNFIIGIPYLFLISTLFSVVAYWLGNFNPTATNFFYWVLWLFLDLLAAESLVVLVASVVPNFVGALAITAFANGLFMSVGGFLVSTPNLNVFWKYAFHYWDYQTYVFQGMMVNEFQDRVYDCAYTAGSCHCLYPSELQDQCKIAGTAVLQQYGYSTGFTGEWLGVMVSIIVGYRLASWLVTLRG